MRTADAPLPTLPRSHRRSADCAASRALDGKLHPRRHCRWKAWRSAFILQMGLEEPQILVELAGDAGEKIRRVGIAEIRRIVDPCAHRLAEDGDLRGQIEQMILPRRDAEGIVLQLAALGGNRDRALGRTAQAGDALRNLVDV